jgi:integrase
MSPQLKEVLQGYLEGNLTNLTNLTRSPKGSWLFPGASDKLPMTPNGFLYLWNKIIRQAGIAHRGPHALRHTWASMLIARNENLLYIRDQLGHSSIKITMDIYGHLMPKAGPSGSARLDDDDFRNPYAEHLLKLVK